jgi:hypothetical protein
MYGKIKENLQGIAKAKAGKGAYFNFNAHDWIYPVTPLPLKLMIL